MFAYVGMFALVLVVVSRFFPNEMRGEVIASLIGIVWFVAKWTLLILGGYALIWIGLHWGSKA